MKKAYSRILLKSIYKSDISPKHLYHSRSRFLKKLMVSVRDYWNRKTNIFFINTQKTKVDQNCYIDLLKNSLVSSMSSTLSGQWLWIPARQCSVTPPKSDATVSTTDHFRLHSCWWMGIIIFGPDLNPLDYCIWDILQDLVYEGRQLPFATCKPMGPERGNQKQMEDHHWDQRDWSSLLSRQFENPLHNAMTTECG